MIKPFIDIFLGKAKPKEIIEQMIKLAAKCFGLSDDVIQIVDNCIKSFGSKSKGQSTLSTAEKFLKTQEGQKVFLELTRIMKIPESVTQLVLLTLKDTKHIEKAVLLIEFAGKQLGINGDVLLAIKDIVLNRDPSMMVLLGCKHLGFPEQISDIAIKALLIAIQKDFKNALIFVICELGKHCRLSTEVMGDIENVMKGQMSGQQVPHLLLVILIQLGKAHGGERIQNFVGELEKILPMTNTLTNILFSVWNNASNRETPKEVIKIILFLLRNFDTEMSVNGLDVLDAIDRLLLHGDPDRIVTWFSKVTRIDKPVLSKIVEGFYDCSNIIDILITFYLDKYGCSKYSSDLILMVHGKTPQHILRKLNDVMEHHGSKHINTLCDEMGIPPHVASLVHILLSKDDACHKVACCCKIIAKECGIPDDLADGLVELIVNKKYESFASWIKNSTGTDSPFITIALECIANRKIDRAAITKAINYLCRVIELSDEQIDKVNSALFGRLSSEDVEKLILRILCKTLLRYVDRFAKELKIPTELIERCFNIENMSNAYEVSFGIAELMAIQIGISTDLVAAIKSIVFNRNCDMLSCWLSEKFGIDQTLVLSILKTLQNGKNISDGLIKIPICMARYYNMSEETVTIVQSLLNGKAPESEIKDIILTIMKDVAKVCFDENKLEVFWSIIGAEDWVERIFHLFLYFVPKLGLPNCMIDGVKCVLQIRKQRKANERATTLIGFIGKQMGISRSVMNGVKDVMLKGDLTKLIHLGCLHFGLREDLTVLIANVLSHVAKKNYSSAFSASVKECGAFFGLSLEQTTDLEKLLNGKKPKHGLPLFILQLFTQVGKVHGNQNVKEIVVKIEQLTPIASELISMMKIISTRGKQIMNGTSLSFASKFILFLLRHMTVHEETLIAIDQLLHHHNPDIIVSWLSRVVTCLDQQTLLKLAELILSECNIRQVIKVLLEFCSKKYSFPAELSDDIDLFISGNKPTHILKKLRDLRNDNTTRKQILDQCSEFGIPSNVSNFVANLLAVDDENNIAGYLSVIAKECGLHDDLVQGLIDLVEKKDGDLLASWITNGTRIPEQIVCFALECAIKRTLDKQTISKTIRRVCMKVGLTEQDVHKLYDALEGKISTEEIEKLLLQLFIRKASPYVYRLAAEWNIPSDVIATLLDLENVNNPSKLFVPIAKLLAFKVGVPAELVNAAISILVERDFNPITGWISCKTGIDNTLLLSILNSVQHEQTLLKGLINIPICVARHYKLSDETIAILRNLLEGKTPECDNTKLVLTIAKDICNVCLDADAFEMLVPCFTECDWLDRAMCLLRYLAKKLDIPVEWVDALKELIHKRDPTQFLGILAEKCGIDKEILSILVNAIKNGASPKDVLKRFAVYAGIPGPAMEVIEQVMKNKTSVGKSKMYKLYTSPINWQKVCRTVKVAV